MGMNMKTGFALFCSTALFCSGCATVNLTSMAGSDDAAPTTAAEADINVVQRAVLRLRDAFASRGFGAHSSERKMQAAADMLLNGLSATQTSADDAAYGDTVRDSAMILEDIRVARVHVEQTTRAADVYLEVAPTRRNLQDELSHLEAALLASEKAAKMFGEAIVGEDPTELILLRQSVDSLREVTNEFGARVRTAKRMKSEDPSVFG